MGKEADCGERSRRRESGHLDKASGAGCSLTAQTHPNARGIRIAQHAFPYDCPILLYALRPLRFVPAVRHPRHRLD